MAQRIPRPAPIGSVPIVGPTAGPAPRTTTPYALAFSPIPDYTFPKTLDVGVVAKDTLAKTQRKVADTQLAVCGANEPLRYGYGRNRVGALILRPVFHSGLNKLLVPFIIARGPIDAVEAVEIDDKPISGDVGSVVTYIGDPGQVVDPTLKQAWLALGITYADTLPGIAWGMVTMQQHNAVPSFNITITARMLNVYDPRLDSTNGGSGAQRLADPTTWTYSACPALCLANMLSNSVYGKGESVDWASVITLANLNDAVVGTMPRRSIGLMVEQQVDLDSWEATLRSYAGCWIVREGAITRLIPDVAGSVVYAFTNAAGSNYIADSIKISQRRRAATPTVVSVVWTDTTQKPWAAQTYTQPSAQAQAGTLPWREEVVQFPGIQNLSMAVRESIRRLNEYMAADISGSLVSTDPAIQLRIGDVVSVTDSGGMAAKQFRLTGHRPAALGRWQETLVEYDASIYSDAVVTQGGTPDSNLPDPSAPPAVTGLVAVEEVFQLQTGLYASRLRVDWADSTFVFGYAYQVDVLQAGTLVDSGTPRIGTSEFVTKALPEGLLYTVNVALLSTVGAVSPVATVATTTLGKLALPGPVTGFSGFEVGGEVRLTFTPGVDFDTTATEFRYAANFGAASDDTSLQTQWLTAIVIDRVALPAIRYNTKVVPPGNWRIYAKALDSVRSLAFPFGQESVTPAFIDLPVTSDINAFVAGSATFVSPFLFNMVAQVDGNGATSWVTNFADTWSSLFPAAMSTYTNPLNSYHTAGTSGLWTEVYDYAVALAGDWTASMPHADLSGVAQVYLDLIVAPDAPKNIIGATNATPIVMNVVAHGNVSADEVVQTGVLGNLAANGRFQVTVIDADHYSLQTLAGVNVAGSGAYTSGGLAARWLWQEYSTLAIKTTARYARLRITTTGAVQVSSLGAVQVNVVARREGGSVTTSASGPTIVTFANRYNAAVTAGVFPTGTVAAYGVRDQVEVSGNRGMPSGQALRFNGVSDYVDVPDSVPTRLSTAMTLVAMVNMDAITGVTQLIARKDTETGTQYMWGLQIHTNGVVRAIYKNVTGTFSAASFASLAPRRWTCVAMTINGTALSCIIDGILNGTAVISGTQNPPTGRMTFGCDPPSVANGGVRAEFLAGAIDDVRLWNVAKTPAQILAAMSAPLVGNEANLVGYWKLDSLSGVVATDSTANVNHGTVSGAKWRPLDGMDVYAFNSAGAQVASSVDWSFAGV